MILLMRVWFILSASIEKKKKWGTSLGNDILSEFGQGMHITICASLRENLSSVCPTKRVSNQSPQLQRLARKLKFHL